MVGGVCCFEGVSGSGKRASIEIEDGRVRVGSEQRVFDLLKTLFQDR